MLLETSCSSSSMCAPSEEDVTAMDRLMSDGKRNYICEQPQLALECFVELCEKLSKCYGQESDKCVEAYLYYGKTLLDIARLENGVLGHAIKEAPVFGSETEGDDEVNTKELIPEDDEELTPRKRENIRDHVEHAMREDNLYNVSTEEELTEEEGDEDESNDTKDEACDTKDESNDNKDEAEDSNKDEAEDSNKSGGACPKPEETQSAGSSEKDIQVKSLAEDGEKNTTGTSEDVQKTKEEDLTAQINGHMEVDDGIDCEGSDEDCETDDVSNMELSWEMFELTSLICKRQLQEEGHDRKAVTSILAEAKYGLAQISLETERYEDSVKDFNECLVLYTEVIEDQNDRRIAEAHYNIALALSFDKKFLEAIERFEKAVSILKARVSDLDSKVKDSEEKGAKNEKAPVELVEWKKEIGELNDLILLDMMAKIEDAHESKKLLDETIKTVKNAASDMFSSLSGKKNEFDAGFDEGFDAPLTTDVEVVHDCSNKIRSIKRKSDDETSDICEKKMKNVITVEESTNPTNTVAAPTE